MSSIALRTAITDPELRSYVQQYPFLTGPDELANARALSALRTGIRISRCKDDGEVHRKPHETLSLTQAQNTAACDMLRATGMPEAQIRDTQHDFGWRVSQVPSDAALILCLGSGAGDELAFLRAKAPAARIVVMDYVQKIREGLLQAVNAEFIQCDLVHELSAQTTQYDIVFSNHTLEHMFDPDQVLNLIYQRLRVGGMIVSGLPLDGDSSVPLHAAIVKISEKASELHAIDLGMFDAGHPWKTNAADLKNSLINAGFSDIEIFQRSEAPYRSQLDDDRLSRLPRKLLVLTHAAIFQTTRFLLKLLFPHTPPMQFCKLLVAIERRVPFGANKLKNRYSPDVTFSALKRVE